LSLLLSFLSFLLRDLLRVPRLLRDLRLDLERELPRRDRERRTWIGETWNAFPIATFAETLTGAATLCGANVNFATGNALNENDVTWILDAETLTVESANAAFQMGMAHGAASIAARAISSLTVARVDDSKACRHLPSWNPSPLLQTVVSPQLYHLRISSLPSRGVHGSQARGLPPFQALAGPEIALIAEWLVFQHLRPMA